MNKIKVIFLSLLLCGCSTTGSLNNSANININKHGASINIGGYYNNIFNYYK